jgi:hypothetical protein
MFFYALAWIVLGVGAYGMTLAEVSIEEPFDIDRNRASACIMAMWGPFGLTAALVLSKGARHGFKFRSDK